MSSVRSVENVWESRPTLEGAGVKLRRVFGFDEAPALDPFLLLDHFGSKNPEDYIKGFPWHPHRGIETVTYMIEGEVEHGDSIGNKGVIYSGDVQWMTAGSGIIHQEMPNAYEGEMKGFQLWVNLPAENKMMDPRYRGLTREEIPEAEIADGVRVKIISGKAGDTSGPVTDIVVDIQYMDVTIDPGIAHSFTVQDGYTVFTFVFEGSGSFCGDPSRTVESDHLVFFRKDGDTLDIAAGENGVRFMLACGKPIGEPVAWGGPIVMNTDDELRRAFEEYQNGTFIKVK